MIKKNDIKKIIILLLVIVINDPLFSDESNDKYLLWQTPGFFKGFNINYWSYQDDYVKTLKDIEDLKNTGANLIKINIYNGTINWRFPYEVIPENEEALTAMIEYCRDVDIYYVIDVRAGPGRKDVAEENIDTIWNNMEEQRLYAEMLKNYVIEYGDDPLFVGLNLMVEPNPLWREIENDDISSPKELEQALRSQNIDVNKMFGYFISQIRTVNSTLPCIVQNVSYSDPEWWQLMEKQSDPYIVYDVHSYVPYEYSHARERKNVEYPGIYWCMTTGDEEVYNKTILNNIIFKYVKNFQNQNDVPVILGEFGMQYQHTGGVTYLSDYIDIAEQEGWHFALWNYRSDDPDSDRHDEFDPEKWDPEYWAEILSWFE